MATQKLSIRVPVTPIKAQMTQAEILEFEVDEAIKEGRFVPAMRQVLLDLARLNKPLFERALKASPKAPEGPQKEQLTFRKDRATRFPCPACQGGLDWTGSGGSSECPHCSSVLTVKGARWDTDAKVELVQGVIARAANSSDGVSLTPLEIRFGRESGQSLAALLQAKRDRVH
jgi:hypothetical protein